MGSRCQRLEHALLVPALVPDACGSTARDGATQCLLHVLTRQQAYAVQGGARLDHAP